MIRFVLAHFVRLDASALHDYRFERFETDGLNATADLDLFDASGNLVFQGSEFHSGLAGYWRPSHSARVSASENDWGHPHEPVLPEGARQ